MPKKEFAPFLILAGPDEELDEELLREATYIVPAFSREDFWRKYDEMNDSRSHGGTVFMCYWWNAKEGQYDRMEMSADRF